MDVSQVVAFIRAKGTEYSFSRVKLQRDLGCSSPEAILIIRHLLEQKKIEQCGGIREGGKVIIRFYRLKRDKVTADFAESYQWWANFLQARMEAIRAMLLLGKSREEIGSAINLEGVQLDLLIGQATGLNKNSI